MKKLLALLLSLAVGPAIAAGSRPSPTFNTVTAIGSPHHFFASDWLTPLVSWPVVTSNLISISPIGQTGLMGASETKDTTTNPVAIGVAGYGFNNLSTGTQQTSWGGYFEGRQYPGVTANAYGIEDDVANVTGVDSTESTPYAFSPPLTIGMELGSGAGVNIDTPPLTPHIASMGLFFASQPSTFKTGILFQNNAIAGTNGNDGLTGDAISLATGHIIRWWQPSGGGGGYIYSAQTSGPATGLVFQNDGAHILGSGQVSDSVRFANTNPASGTTTMSLLINNNIGVNIVPVTLGAPNSGGTGYRALIVPN